MYLSDLVISQVPFHSVMCCNEQTFGLHHVGNAHFTFLLFIVEIVTFLIIHLMSIINTTKVNTIKVYEFKPRLSAESTRCSLQGVEKCI